MARPKRIASAVSRVLASHALTCRGVGTLGSNAALPAYVRGNPPVPLDLRVMTLAAAGAPADG